MLPRTIASEFNQNVVNLEPLGNGLINDTFLVKTDTEPFVLQKVNRQVFHNPELIMANLAALNQHIASYKVNQNTLKIPELIQTETGRYFVIDEKGDCWRAWSYVANTDCLEELSNLDEAEQVGSALGKFHCLCHDLDTTQFHDTLPGFHITPNYFISYQKVISRTTIPENTECKNFIERNVNMVNELENAKAGGLLTIRVTHGDPKLNNFLFDKDTKRIVSLIDLDTVKPGLIHYDIGDCLRSCCHKETDDSFDLKICKALLTGYINEMGERLTEQDFDYFYSAIRLIPFELGLRFYTDYLDGNHYFKVNNPEQNLHRAQQQFALCNNILRQENELQHLICQIKTKLYY